jgi:hypothetical protein
MCYLRLLSCLLMTYYCDRTADFMQRQADRGSSSWSFRKTGTQGGAGGVLRSMVVSGSDLELAAA